MLVGLLRWGDRWAPAEGGGPVELTHAGCGEPVRAELRCAAGHEVHAPDIHVAPSAARIRALENWIAAPAAAPPGQRGPNISRRW